MDKVQEIQHCVGIECKGFEEQFMAFLTTIKFGNNQTKKSGAKKKAGTQEIDVVYQL